MRRAYYIAKCANRIIKLRMLNEAIDIVGGMIPKVIDLCVDAHLKVDAGVRRAKARHGKVCNDEREENNIFDKTNTDNKE